MAAYMTYFGCSPRKGTKGGGLEGGWGGAKYEETITAALSLSAPAEIASKERKKKDGGDQKEEGRFWLKVWCKVRGRRERGAAEKVTEGEREKEKERVRGGCEQDCISSLRSGRLNQQCQVFFLEAAWCFSH